MGKFIFSTALNSDLKAKVAIAALKGQQTVNEIAAEFGLHPTQINSWKKQLLESSSNVFGKGRQKREADFEVERELKYGQIGQLKVEVDWLKKSPDISTERTGKSRHGRSQVGLNWPQIRWRRANTIPEPRRSSWGDIPPASPPSRSFSSFPIRVLAA